MRINRKSDRLGLALFQRREIWLPTRRGWVLILLPGAGLGFLWVRQVHPFLAVTDPVAGGVLIGEGWMPEYAFGKVVEEFKRHQYDKLYVTGGPAEFGAASSGQSTYAEVGAAIARSKRLPPDVVQAVPAPMADKDRTYTSALAFRTWLHDHGVTPRSYRVISFGPHARRARLLFEKALGEKAVVGITAIDVPSYDPNRWWNTSAGARIVIGEMIAYCYSRFFFGPQID